MQGVEDNTQVSHDTAGGEGGRNLWAAMDGDERFGAVRGGMMMEGFNGCYLVHGESNSDT